MIDKPSLLDTPNLINGKEYTVSPIPGASVDDCYAKDSLIRGDYDGSDTNEWDVGKLVQETLPAAEWDAWIHDLTGFGWQMTEVVRSIWEEIYCLINGAQAGMAQQAITQLLSGAQTFTNKTISFNSNTLTNVASLDTAQTLTNKTIAFGSNTLTDVASTNTTQTLTGKTLDLNLDTNKITVGTANRVLVSDASKKIVPAADTTDTEIGYVHGVTSAIQTQLDGKQATITGAATSITGSNLTASRALVSDSSGKVAASSVTSTELGYVSGVTSAIQTQINGKQATITGAATSITSSDLTANKALISNGSGKVAASSVTSTELGYVSGVTSAIQTQLNGKQATITGAATTITGSDLTASKALVSNASGKVAVSSVTSTELGYVSGVTSAIQTQINGKQATITGGATTITSSNLTASRVLVSDANGKVAAGSIASNKIVGTDSTQTLTNKTITLGTANRALITNGSKNIAVSSVTSTELGYVSGVTSSIQTQINKITGSSTRVVISNPNTGYWGTATKMWYVLQGGMCTVTFWPLDVKSAALGGTGLILCQGMPKAATDCGLYLFNADNAHAHFIFINNGSTTIAVNTASNGITGQQFGSFTYPVDLTTL